MWPMNFFSIAALRERGSRRGTRGDVDRGQRFQQVTCAPDLQVRAGEQRSAGQGFRVDPHRRAPRGHGLGVLDRHRLVVPARDSDRSTTPAHLRDR
jgi:hypothetical protein